MEGPRSRPKPGNGSRLPERLRGVLLPEISRIFDLVDHTGLPEAFWQEELRVGRLRGRFVGGGQGWLIHRHAVAEWLNAAGMAEANNDA